MNEGELESSIKEYESQLLGIQSALLVADEETKLELQKLETDLKQLIELTKDSLLSLKKSRLLAQLDELSDPPAPKNEGEDEESANRQEFTESPAEDDHNLDAEFSSLEGSKCRAPFSHEWGEHSYHNAVVLSVEPTDTIASLQDIQVRVMFCNPTSAAMKPCPFFLDGKCKFSESSCRFSHGHVVKLEELTEFQNPDYSLLECGCKCFARFTDDLWYKGTVEETLQDHKFVVKYDQYGNSAELDLHEIMPIDLSSDTSSDSEDEEVTKVSISTSIAVTLPVVNVNALGAWEQHTRGIGSKLMAKMGFVLGQGLGKNGEGRTEPVEAVVFPAGKSLDTCLQLREKGALTNPMKRKRFLKKQRLKAAKIAARYDQPPRQDSVFDFLNKRLTLVKNSSEPSTSKAAITKLHKESSTQNLNVKSMQLAENIKQVQKELSVLNQSLKRNKTFDKLMTDQLQRKITVKEKELQTLRQTEQSVAQEQKTRQVHRQMTIF